MSEIKSNQRKDTAEVRRFDLASLFDAAPTDQDLKIVELRRGRTPREKLQRASEGRTLAQKFAA